MVFNTRSDCTKEIIIIIIALPTNCKIIQIVLASMIWVDVLLITMDRSFIYLINVSIHLHQNGL